MSEKVILTKEQAEALDRIFEKTTLNKDAVVDLHAEGTNWSKWGSSLNELSVAVLAKALYIGYEVKPEYKEGDFVIYEGKTVQIKHILKGEIPHTPYLISFSVEGSDKWFDYKRIERYATPSEIAEEKERRWWRKHGRDVWELKQGDIVIGPGRELYEITATPKNHGWDCYTGNDSRDITLEELKKDYWEVICFNDDRKD